MKAISLLGLIGATLLTLPSLGDSKVGRWCSPGGAHVEKHRAPLYLQCEGYSGGGHVLDSTPLRSISFELEVERGNSLQRQFVTVPTPMLTVANVTARQRGHGQAELKTVFLDYVKQNSIKLIQGAVGPGRVALIEIDEDTPVYDDVDATRLLKPNDAGAVALLRIDDTHRFSKVIRCLSSLDGLGLELLPQDVVFDAGDAAHQPLVLLQALSLDGELADAVFTTEGFYLHRYQDNPKSHGDIHHLSVPGNKRFPATRWYIHGFASLPQEPLSPLYGPPRFLSAPSEVARHLEPTALGPTDFFVKDSHPAIDALNASILDSTRKFKEDFDAGNPRFSSQNNLRALARAVNSCKELQLPEIDLFETHVFDQGRNGVSGRPM